MEGPSVLGPSSWHKRLAWVRQSRGWRSPAPEGDQEQEQEQEEEEEEEAASPTWDTPEPPPHPDEVFLEGSPSSRIRTWLQRCGAAALDEPGLPGPCACGDSGTSFEDDLSLGAEALLLPGSRGPAGRAPRDGHLSLGHSMASSVPSSVPSGVPSSVPSSLATRTSSSLSEVLARCQSDPEEILHNLGFVGSDPGVASRVPPRFFSAPSRASGIDFQLFLRAQVRRLETEDPCLLLASRFQQVQALAATADAFFCLYSHVSRTPLQRIAPPRLARPCRDIPDPPERRGAPRPGPAPAGERLKRALTSLCLYPGGRADPAAPGTGRPRGAPGAAPGGGRGDGDAGTLRRGPPPRPPPLGTAAGTAWGHPERRRPRGPGGGDGAGPGARGAGGGPCPARAARGDTRDPPPDAAAPGGGVAASPPPGPPRVTPAHPAGPRPRGDSGVSWCRPGAAPRAGDPRAPPRGGPTRLQPPGRVPSPPTQQGPADSFELEEVLSEDEEDEEDEDEDDDEEEDDDDDAPDEAARSPHGSVRTRRSSLAHGRSDSSGFGEDPAPTPGPPARPRRPDWVT